MLRAGTVGPRDGELDFKGSVVHGKRGERFLYLTWGQVHDGTFDMFRRANLVLNAVDPQLVARATAGGTVVGRNGAPDRCARRTTLRQSRPTRPDLAGRLTATLRALCTGFRTLPPV
jgi:hypothetical protein